MPPNMQVGTGCDPSVTSSGRVMTSRNPSLTSSDCAVASHLSRVKSTSGLTKCRTKRSSFGSAETSSGRIVTSHTREQTFMTSEQQAMVLAHSMMTPGTRRMSSVDYMMTSHDRTMTKSSTLPKVRSEKLKTTSSMTTVTSQNPTCSILKHNLHTNSLTFDKRHNKRDSNHKRHVHFASLPSSPQVQRHAFPDHGYIPDYPQRGSGDWSASSGGSGSRPPSDLQEPEIGFSSSAAVAGASEEAEEQPGTLTEVGGDVDADFLPIQPAPSAERAPIASPNPMVGVPSALFPVPPEVASAAGVGVAGEQFAGSGVRDSVTGDMLPGEYTCKLINETLFRYIHTQQLIDIGVQRDRSVGQDYSSTMTGVPPNNQFINPPAPTSK